MFVVEPPDHGEAEAETIPAGPTGDLLADIIAKGLKLSLSDSLITSLVKCPVDDPEDASSVNFRPCALLTRREIELAKPKLVLAMGLMPGQALVGTDLVMARLRLRKAGLPGGIPLRVTYGLSAMVAEPVLKKEVWRDLKVIFGMG
jgi:DNA polymerase